MTAALRVLDLFSGIGGFSLGLERAGMRTVAFCEIDRKCQRVLRRHWPHVPVFDDVRTLDATALEIDVVCGGFPCQPFSTAARGRRRFVLLAHADGESEPRRAVNAQVASLRELPECREEDDAAPVGMDDGLPGRMDALRQLGNSISPWIAEQLGLAVVAASPPLSA